MNKQQATGLVNQFLEYLFTDFTAASEMLTEDFVWENFLPDHVPFGRSYKGVAGLSTYLGELAETWGLGEIVFHDYIYDPETRIMAIPGVEKNAKALPTGRSCDMDFIWEFRFTEDGKIRYVREYNDTNSIGDTFDR